MQQQRLIFSVSELNNEVSYLLRDGLHAIWLEGEISNLSRPASGHLYFSLKDRQAQIRCALFKNRSNANLRQSLSNGQSIIAYGNVALYEARGDYQFIIERLEDAGEGQLQKQYELLKQKLQLEGLFETAHKQTIPSNPKHIGVITSASGAAIQDVLKVLQRRAPHVPVTLYPTLVQGQQAAKQIVNAIKQANATPRCDVLLLTRGGGSLEDLWPFNEEQVARSVFASRLPIISAIGHEVDFTITDFVADQRAPTPSAAAEMLSPDREAWLQQLQSLDQRLNQALQRQYQDALKQLTQLQQRLTRQHPHYRLQQKAQQLDELSLRLQHPMRQTVKRAHEQLQQLQQRLTRSSPTRYIPQQQQALMQLQQRLQRAIALKLQLQQQQLQQMAVQLHTLSPLATLDRGYAIARNTQQQLISSIQQVQSGETVIVQLRDGTLETEVKVIT